MNRTYIGLGIFVVGTLGLLVWLAQSIGAIGGGGGNRYELRLAHAAGLVENNAVKIAGVHVGRIEEIGVDHDIAILTLRVDEEVVLHEDAGAIVRAKSLLGEKYLQLEPGTREAPPLADGGEILNVQAPFEIDEVLNALQPILGGEDSMAAALAPLARTLSDLLNDAAGKNGEPAIISRAEIRQIIEDTKATSASVRRITEETEEPLKELVDQSNVLVARSNKLVGDSRLPKVIGRVDSMTKTLDDELPELLERTESAITKLEKLAAVVDDDRAKKIGKIIDDATVATANLRKLSSGLEGFDESIEALMDDLSTIAKRATKLDENVIRKFLQKEGVKIYVGNKREANRAIGD